MIEAIIAAVTSIIGLILYFVKSHAASAPIRKDKELDEAVRKGGMELGAQLHDLNDRMRRQDPSSD